MNTGVTTLREDGVNHDTENIIRKEYAKWQVTEEVQS